MATSSTPEGLDDVWDDWQQAVTTTAEELEDWLQTDESPSVGQEGGGAGSESTGHAEGRRTVEVLRTAKADLTEDDAEHSRWRCSLMDWGHDPLTT